MVQYFSDVFCPMRNWSIFMKKVQLENLNMQAQNLLIKGKAKKAFKLF